MGTLNVNRNVADAFYRYKMPRICAKVEGKGNGIKTVIVNMPEVAKALGRPATCEYFCPIGFNLRYDGVECSVHWEAKFLQQELMCQSQKLHSIAKYYKMCSLPNIYFTDKPNLEPRLYL